jgi:hypothetical protein
VENPVVSQNQSETTSQTKTGTTPITPISTGTTKSFNHNAILHLPTFQEKGAAIAARLEKIKADPKYQALPEEHKAKVRADLYDKFVPKSYAGYHLPIPDKNTWVGATGQSNNTPWAGRKMSETYGSQGKSSDYWRHNEESRQDIGAGMYKGMSEISMFGAKLADRAFLGMHQMADYFSPNPVDGKLAQSYLKSKTHQQFQNDEYALHSKIQSADYWLQTHPRDTIIGRLDGMVGEQVAQLPLYEAIGTGGALSKIGSKLPLSAKLVSSPVGKWVGKRLIEASDGFVTSLVTSGGDKQEAAKGAAGFAAFGAAGEAGGSLLKSIASRPLIKKWMANIVAMGGRPLGNELIKSAARELTPIDWWVENVDKAGYTAGSNMHELGNGITVIPKSEEEGHLFKDGIAYPYAGKKQQQTVYNTLMQNVFEQTLADRAKNDPVLDKMHAAAKMALESLAQSKFGKSFAELTDEENSHVISEHMVLNSEAAAEAPALLPDLTRNEVEGSIKKQRTENPIMNSVMASLEKHGVKFVEDVTENSTQDVAKQTGISNADAASKKIKKTTKPVGEEISPAKFASLNADTLEYMRAPRNRTAFAEAVSDTSRDGANKFIDELKKASPAAIRFEDPAHLMLYHYGNRKELDKGIVTALRYRLRQTKEYSAYTAEQLDKAAKYMHNHMYDMAKSGRLRTEGNIFRSTKTSGPMAWSPWQAPLADEADQRIVSATEKALKNHPTALKGFQTVVKALQATGMKATTPEDYQAYKDTLADFSSTIRKEVNRAKRTGTPFQFGGM